MNMDTNENTIATQGVSHTPWTYEYQEIRSWKGWKIYGQRPEGTVSDAMSGEEVQRERPIICSVTRGEQYAALLAAAPDLLAALQAFEKVEDFSGWHPNYRDAIEAARAAILKATK